MSRSAKRARTCGDNNHWMVDVWKREMGQLSTRNFAHRLAASQDLVLRLQRFTKLEKHRGCVNTVSFNAGGDILVSGSDDRRVILWDWESGKIKLSFHTAHRNNVFQAKFMPFSDDCSLVTCAADGQVRHAKILEGGVVESYQLGRHQGRAHKLAIEPGSPHIFYTCGEDGVVQHCDLRTGVSTNLFVCPAVDDRRYRSVVRLNTIAIDPRNPNLFAVAGTDEYARVYDIRKYKWDASTGFGQPTDYFCPPHLINDEQVGITGLAFSDQSELVVSYNDEFIYLFTRDMGLGPNPTPSSPSSMETDANNEMKSDSNDKMLLPQVYKGHRNSDTVKGVNFFGPKCEYVVSGSDCGRIFIWRKKDGELIHVMEADKHIVNCIEPHPHIPVLASSGIEHDIKIWTPKATERATLPENIDQVVLPGRIRWFSLQDGAEDYYFYGDIFDHDEEEEESDNPNDEDSDESLDDYDDDEEEEEDEDDADDDDDDSDNGCNNGSDTDNYGVDVGGGEDANDANNESHPNDANNDNDD